MTVARVEDGKWCIDLSYVDKTAKIKNKEVYLIVRQKFIDGTVESKKLKTTDTKKIYQIFSTDISIKTTQKLLLAQGTENVG